MTGNVNGIDWCVVVAYLVATLLLAWWKGSGRQKDSSSYFFAERSLPWWVMAAAYVTTGMNTEQLVGMNGVAYSVGLPLLNWFYTAALVVCSLLIFVFFPIYLRNRILTVPQYLGRRFDRRSENVFSLILLVSYVLVNLAVVFYGGAKCLSVIFGGDLMFWLVVLGVVSGLVTLYGGMASMAYTSVLQFVLIFGSGFVLFFLAYMKLPNGWSDVVASAPCGFHLIKPSDYPEIPWQAIPLTLLSLHLYYSCISQAMVQRGFGGKTEWDVRMAIIAVGFAVFFRPVVEVFPGMIARALVAGGFTEFAPRMAADGPDLDSLLPILVKNLVMPGFIGLLIVGILSSVMSTISAFLGSISTLFTFDVYRKWIRPQASEKELVRVGIAATAILMAFGICYSPLIGYFGGIFKYFQTMTAYIAAPVATVYLFGIFWRRTTPAAALSIMLGGIPLGIAIHWILPHVFSAETMAGFSLGNPFVEAGICQIVCAILMVVISLMTTPRPVAEIEPLVWKWKLLWLPEDEPKRRFFCSVPFWWSVFIVFYICVVAYLW